MFFFQRIFYSFCSFFFFAVPILNIGRLTRENVQTNDTRMQYRTPRQNISSHHSRFNFISLILFYFYFYIFFASAKIHLILTNETVLFSYKNVPRGKKTRRKLNEKKGTCRYEMNYNNDKNTRMSASSIHFLFILFFCYHFLRT